MTAPDFNPGPGIYHGVDNDVYHASHGISNTGLGDILQSPYHYWSRHIDPNRPERPPTLAQDDGNIAHCAILEPDEFTHRYVVGPDLRRNTTAWRQFCEVHNDKTVIKPEQYTRAMRQRDAVWAIPEVAKALSRGHPEVSAYAEDPETGVLCRVRPDFVHEYNDDSDILVDVKTYTTAQPTEFQRQVARMSYHRQDAYYTDIYKAASGRKVINFIFVSVEMGWPHAASACVLDDEGKLSGLIQYQRALRIYRDCLANDCWPGYSDNIQLISLPDWAKEND